MNDTVLSITTAKWYHVPTTNKNEQIISCAFHSCWQQTLCDKNFYYFTIVLKFFFSDFFTIVNEKVMFSPIPTCPHICPPPSLNRVIHPSKCNRETVWPDLPEQGDLAPPPSDQELLTHPPSWLGLVNWSGKAPSNAAITLERKQKRKRRRFEWIPRFPSCVFTLERKRFRLEIGLQPIWSDVASDVSLSLQYNCTLRTEALVGMPPTGSLS